MKGSGGTQLPARGLLCLVALCLHVVQAQVFVLLKGSLVALHCQLWVLFWGIHILQGDRESPSQPCSQPRHQQPPRGREELLTAFTQARFVPHTTEHDSRQTTAGPGSRHCTTFAPSSSISLDQSLTNKVLRGILPVNHQGNRGKSTQTAQETSRRFIFPVPSAIPGGSCCLQGHP